MKIGKPLFVALLIFAYAINISAQGSGKEPICKIIESDRFYNEPDSLRYQGKECWVYDSKGRLRTDSFAGAWNEIHRKVWPSVQLYYSHDSIMAISNTVKGAAYLIISNPAGLPVYVKMPTMGLTFYIDYADSGTLKRIYVQSTHLGGKDDVMPDEIYEDFVYADGNLTGFTQYDTTRTKHKLFKGSTKCTYYSRPCPASFKADKRFAFCNIEMILSYFNVQVFSNSLLKQVTTTFKHNKVISDLYTYQFEGDEKITAVIRETNNAWSGNDTLTYKMYYSCK